MYGWTLMDWTGSGLWKFVLPKGGLAIQGRVLCEVWTHIFFFSCTESSTKFTDFVNILWSYMVEEIKDPRENHMPMNNHHPSTCWWWKSISGCIWETYSWAIQAPVFMKMIWRGSVFNSKWAIWVITNGFHCIYMSYTSRKWFIRLWTNGPTSTSFQ